MRSLHSDLEVRSQNCCSSWIARLASFTLRVMVCSSPTRLSFTSCWVMVEPPWETPPASLLACSARRIERALTPSCS